MRVATSEYRDESDLLGEFVADRCVEGVGYASPAGHLYAAFSSWCSAQGIKAGSVDFLTLKSFGTRLTERYRKRHTKYGTEYEGIALRSDTHSSEARPNTAGCARPEALVDWP